MNPKITKRWLLVGLMLALLAERAPAGVVGDTFTPALPSVGVTAGPTWASDLNTVITELITRASSDLDSASINLTTGDVRHATRYKQFGAAACHSAAATWTPGTGATAGYWLGAGASNTVECAVELERNQRVTAVRMTGRSTGTAWTYRVWLVTTSTGARAQLGSTQTSGTATSIEELSVTSLTTTLANGQHVIAEWTAGAASTRMLAVEVEYDRPTAN